MSARQLSSRLIHDVQQVLASNRGAKPDTDEEQLAALAREVLGSIDVRVVEDLASDRIVAQLEHVLQTIGNRKKGEIVARLSTDAATEGVVLETCMEDQPFLVSTVRALLGREKLKVGRAMNAIVQLQRDPAGKIVRIGSGKAESVMRFEIAGGRPEEGLEDRLRNRLSLARAMVQDFEAMQSRISEAADNYFAVAADRHGEEASDLREVEALLRWLCDENQVILSVEEYGKDCSPGTMLGVARVQKPTRDERILTQASEGTGRLVHHQRSMADSPVHRAGKPGHFAVPRFDASGQAVGCLVIAGLFTYKALHTPPEEIPFVRIALREMLVDREVATTSHRGKTITNAFNSIPLEYLLAESRASIWELTDLILRAEEAGGSDVHIRVGEGGRFAFAFVALPRTQYSEELRQEVQALLVRTLGATYADHGVYMDRYENAVMHFYVTGDEPIEQIDTEALRDQILALARGWQERLRDAIKLLGDEAGGSEDLFEIYKDAFDEVHKRRASMRRVSRDIACIESLRAGANYACDLYVSEFGDHPGSLNMRVFAREIMNLSHLLPVIGNFGVEVIDGYHRNVQPLYQPVMEFDNFRLGVREDRVGQIISRRADVVEAMRQVFDGEIGDDSLNRLVATTTMTGRDVEILRAYVSFLQQLKTPFDTRLIRDVLVDNPTVTQALMAYLAARFDPESADEALEESTSNALDAELRRVSDYTADRVLRAVIEVFRATRRTNAYSVENYPAAPFAFKVASTSLSYGPKPRPLREIWVYSTEMEGVHLRGGRIARGGLRFSDRPDDFRTEIHGLAATQMVKNAVIVPVGAKGGFVIRNPPAKRDALRAAGDKVYEQFINALLSITDNVVDGKVVTPKGILHRGQPDPYLVVAADKGTAHLSDTANRISMDQGFWLDDAFASGGSNGYDHKKTGVTARGAWVAATRSFYELGIDPEADVITAVGVGDMSGDVFGNGLLRSKTVKLRAAFNHMHIFLDPDPDPGRSYEERKRLFEMGRSQWSDYAADVLSEGGGVYPRDSKSVDLSPQARAMLEVGPDESLSGDEVLRRILTMEVDLLWMGGIGTYVKAGGESDADVGDKANDSARVLGRDLRCRVLAEGANLAITDRGRAEFAQTGGHNYNAFHDNSAGVDTSDHEVNIKILLAPLVSAGKVSREQRNQLLADCEAEVVDVVLDNNRRQSRMVSYDVRRSQQDIHRYARTLRHLARDVPFDPTAFAMPSEEELMNRARKGKGLHKCEAAVLGAHSKLLVLEQLDQAELREEVVSDLVREYFPPAVRELAGDTLDRHLLRREIATTLVVNHIVDNAGATFYPELEATTSRSALEITHAYLDASHAGDAASLSAELYALEDKHRQEVVYGAMADIQGAVEDGTYHLLDLQNLSPLTAEARETARQLLSTVDDVIPDNARVRPADRAQDWIAKGLPEELAFKIARLRYLTPVLDATRLAVQMGRPAKETLALRLRVAADLRIMRLRHVLVGMSFHNAWDGPAANALIRQLNFHLHKMVRLVENDDVQAMFDRFGLNEIREQVSDYLESGISISSLVMLTDRLRRILPPENTIPGHG